jgi:hypothetical protein
MLPIPLDQAPQCGQSIAVPTHGHGNFSISCSTTIAASPVDCLKTVLNISEYPTWNTFCPRAVIEEVPATCSPVVSSVPELKTMSQLKNYLYTGVKFQFEVLMQEGQPTRKTALEVSILEKFNQDGKTGYRVAWKMRGMPYFLLRAERMQVFIRSTEENVTEYFCWETFGGVLSYFMTPQLKSQLEDGFGRWMNGLKAKASRMAKDL